MKRGHRVFLASLVAVGGACGSVVACGSRTGLYDLPNEPSDATPDVLPPIDVYVPQVAPDLCPDGGSTLIYLITQQDILLSFYPPTASFTTIGTIECAVEPGDTPFSMAVDHEGIAYVAFTSGSLFRVSTLTASCTPTPYVPRPGTFQYGFGMGFAANVGADAGDSDADDAVETLYLAGNPDGGITTSPIVLGSLDTTTFQVTSIATVSPSIYGSELTGTGGGQLFGFFETTPQGASAAIAQIDRTTGKLLAEDELPGVNIVSGWAFGFWGGDFYTFTAPDGQDTVIQRFRPSDKSVVQVATTPGLLVVGAGVSTCAPQR